MVSLNSAAELAKAKAAAIAATSRPIRCSLRVTAQMPCGSFTAARMEEDGWVVLVFSVPESERDKRRVLRTTLTRLGFGTARPGVWNRPGTSDVGNARGLERRGLAAYVEIFEGQHVAFGELPRPQS